MAQTTRDHREFMKAQFGQSQRKPSDQELGKPAPPLDKPIEPGRKTIVLPPPDPSVLITTHIHKCLTDRRSRRRYSDRPMLDAQLSYLLWATQGVQQVVAGGKASLRTVPSAGARHPPETYLVIHHVEGILPGLYRYLPLSHQLVHLGCPINLQQRLTEGCLGQEFVSQCSVVFVWTCVPYRGEWRYQTLAHKPMLMDSGHVCQNLYLACEAMRLGTCAIAAYHQQLMDELIGVDGQDEFVVYLAPVGWPA